MKKSPKMTTPKKKTQLTTIKEHNNMIIEDFSREQFILLSKALDNYRIYMTEAEETLSEEILDNVFYPSIGISKPRKPAKVTSIAEAIRKGHK